MFVYNIMDIMVCQSIIKDISLEIISKENKVNSLTKNPISDKLISDIVQYKIDDLKLNILQLVNKRTRYNEYLRNLIENSVETCNTKNKK